MVISITVNSGGGQTTIDDIVWTGYTAPSASTITLSATSLSNFTYIQGNGPSASQSYTLSGSGLTPASGNLTVGGLTNFEVATSSNGTYGPNLNIPYTSGTLASTTIYVRLKSGLTAATYSETAANSGGGATAKNVTLSGSVMAQTAPVLTTATPGSFTATGATLGGAVTSNGGSAVTEYGVVYSTTNNPPTTAAPDTKLQITTGSATSFSQAVTLAPGTYYVRSYAINGVGTGYGSTTATLVVNDVPTISSLSPASVNAGSGTQTLTINGTNFASGATVSYNGGAARTPTFVSATQLTLALAAADVATAGSYPVVVTNPTPGGGTSNSVSLTVVNTTPTVSSISPASANAGTTIPTLTITGTGFGSTSVINFNGNNLTPASISATQLTATNVAVPTAAGSYPVTVTNPAPGGVSNATVALTVNPVLTASPATLAVGNTAQGTASASQSYSLTGSGLPTGGSIAVTLPANSAYEVSSDNATFGPTATVTYSGTTLTATSVYVRLAATAAAGSYGSVAVTNTVNDAAGTATSTTATVTVSGNVLLLAATPNSLSGFSTTVSTVSTAQSYTLQGTALTASVTVTAPSGYEVSKTSATSTFAATQTVTATAANAGQTIWVRLANSNTTPGPIGGNVTNVSTGATSQNVTVSGTILTPILTLTPTSLSGFSTVAGTASTAQSYTLQGTNLGASVTVTAPSGFVVSQTSVTSSFATTQTVTAASANAGITLYTRLAGTTAGLYSGDITHATTGATTQAVSVSGSVASLTASPTSITGFATAPGTASASKNYTLTGTGLPVGGSIVVTPANAAYEVSADNITFTATATLTYSGSPVTPVVYVRLAASAAAGSYNSVTINNTVYTSSNTAVTSASVTVSGRVAAPVLATSASALNGIGAGVLGSVRSVQTYYFTSSTADLNAPVTVTAPAGFEVATTRTGTYSSTLTVTAADALALQSIYVRLSATTVGSYSGTITNTSGSASASVAVTGTVYNLLEPFESASASVYAGGTVAFTTGNWTLVQAGTASSGGDKYFDGQAIRMQSSSTAGRGYIDYNALNGVASISFHAAHYSSSDTGAGLSLQYSTDGGSTYTTVTGSQVTLNSALTQYTYTLNQPGPVRIRIIANSSSGQLRQNIDNVGIILPTLTATPNTLAFTTIPGETSLPSTYTLTGTGLPTGATVAIASNNAAVQVSTDNVTYSTSTMPINVMTTGSTFSQLVYVRYVAPAANAGMTTSYTISNTTGSLTAPVTVSAITPNVYTWNSTGTSVNWSDPANWNPQRTTPAATDALQFTSGSAASTVVLDYTGSQAIGKLLISSPTTFSTDANRTLIINNGSAGTDLVIASGATLTVTGPAVGNTVGLALQLGAGTGATASIAGTLVFGATTSATGTHTLIGSGLTNSVEFAAGSTFRAAVGFTGSAFGSSTAAAMQGNVVFRNGARYEQLAGSDPFGPSQPQAVTVFEPSSTYYYAPAASVAASLSGRTYGNFEYALAGTSTSASGAVGTIAGNLTVSSGTVNINTAGLNLQGNLVLNGGTLSFSPSSAAVVQFNGTTAQNIGGTATASALNLNANVTLQVNNAAGVTLARPVLVPGTLQLTSGNLTTTATNLLTLPLGATINGGSASSFVSGPLARTTDAVAATTTFPIGRGAAYRPLTLTTTAQTSVTTYHAEQVEGDPGQSGTNPAATNGTDLTRVSRVRSFTLTPYSGSTVAQPTGYSGTVTLSYGADDAVTNASALVVAKRDNSSTAWANAGGNGSGTSSSGTATSGTITSFSDFALASTDPSTSANPLPVSLTSFAATRSASSVALTWATASEHNSARFEVERSLDGTSFAPVATVAAHGTSLTPLSYTALDRSAPAAALYYRLRTVDTDGSSAYSAVVVVTAAPTDLTLVPNPAHSQVSLTTAVATAYVVRSALGQVVLRGTTLAGSTSTVEVGSLASGVYFVELLAPTGRLVRKLVKE